MEMMLFTVSWLAIILYSAFLRFFVCINANMSPLHRVGALHVGALHDV